MHDKEKRNTANVNEDIHILITCVRNSPKLHESPLQLIGEFHCFISFRVNL